MSGRGGGTGVPNTMTMGDAPVTVKGMTQRERKAARKQQQEQKKNIQAAERGIVPPTATSTGKSSNLGSVDELRRLQDAFPLIEAEIVAAVYEANAFDSEKTTEVLVEMGLTDEERQQRDKALVEEQVAAIRAAELAKDPDNNNSDSFGGSGGKKSASQSSSRESELLFLRDLFPELSHDVLTDVMSEVGSLKASLDALLPLSLSQSSGLTDDVLLVGSDDEDYSGHAPETDEDIAAALQRQEDEAEKERIRRIHEDFTRPRVVAPRTNFNSKWASRLTPTSMPSPELIPSSARSLAEVQRLQSVEKSMREDASAAALLPFDDQVARILDICDYEVDEVDVRRVLLDCGNVVLTVEHLLTGAALPNAVAMEAKPDRQQARKPASSKNLLANSAGIGPEEKFQRLRQLFKFVPESTLKSLFILNNTSVSETVRELSTIYPHISATPARAPSSSDASSASGSAKSTPTSRKGARPSPSVASKGQSRQVNERRSEITEHQVRRERFLRQATDSFVQGDKAGAAALVRQGQQEGRLMLEAYTRACEELVSRQASSSNRNVVRSIDLHGYTKDQALAAVVQILKEEDQRASRNHSGSVVRLITGRGVHSAGGVPVLGPAVSDYLTRDHRVFKQHGGEILVRVSR